jgi:hypothetical protein
VLPELHEHSSLPVETCLFHTGTGLSRVFSAFLGKSLPAVENFISNAVT